MEVLAAVSVGIAIFIGATLIFMFFRTAQDKDDKDEQDSLNDAPLEGTVKTKEKSKRKLYSQVLKSKKNTFVFSHPWLVTTLKGHGSEVTSFDQSPNGKYLVSCSADRSIFLWSLGKGLSHVLTKEQKYWKAAVVHDQPCKVKFSPDCRSFIASLENSNTIRVFKFTKKDDGNIDSIIPAIDDYPKTLTADILNIGIDTAGNYVMSADIETRVDILTLKGSLLHSIDTGTMKNYNAIVSPCGRFVAACGFASDAKVWEIMFDKSKTFKGVRRAYDITGHKASILDIAFSADSSRLASISKDGTWRHWKTDIEYANGQDPSLVSTGTHSGKDAAAIALSPDGRTVAVAIENNITLYNGLNGSQEENLENIFQGPILHHAFSVDGKYLFCCGDKQIRVFHNVTGYRIVMYDMKEKLKTCTKNLERRLTEQLQRASDALKLLGFEK